jgi:hypothetical protein
MPPPPIPPTVTLNWTSQLFQTSIVKVFLLNLKVGFVHVKVTVGGIGGRGHIWSNMVKTKNDPQFEIGANPVSKVGVRKIPYKILKKTWKKFGRAPQTIIRPKMVYSHFGKSQFGGILTT